MPEQLRAPSTHDATPAAATPALGGAGRSALHQTLRQLPDYASQAAHLAPVQQERVPRGPAPQVPPQAGARAGGEGGTAPAAEEHAVPAFNPAMFEMSDALDDKGNCERQGHAADGLRESWETYLAGHQADIERWQKSPPKPGSKEYRQYRATYDEWHSAGSKLFATKGKPCDKDVKALREEILNQIYEWRKMGPPPPKDDPTKDDPKKDDPKKDPKKDPTPTPDGPVVTPVVPTPTNAKRFHKTWTLLKLPTISIPCGTITIKVDLNATLTIDAAADMTDAHATIAFKGSAAGVLKLGVVDVGLEGSIQFDANADAQWDDASQGFSLDPIHGGIDIGLAITWDTFGKSWDGDKALGSAEILKFTMPGWSQQGGLQGEFDVSPGKDVEWLIQKVKDIVPGI